MDVGLTVGFCGWIYMWRIYYGFYLQIYAGKIHSGLQCNTCGWNVAIPIHMLQTLSTWKSACNTWEYWCRFMARSTAWGLIPVYRFIFFLIVRLILTEKLIKENYFDFSQLIYFFPPLIQKWCWRHLQLYLNTPKSSQSGVSLMYNLSLTNNVKNEA